MKNKTILGRQNLRHRLSENRQINISQQERFRYSGKLVKNNQKTGWKLEKDYFLQCQCGGIAEYERTDDYKN